MSLRICLLSKRAWENSHIGKTEFLLFPRFRAKSGLPIHWAKRSLLWPPLGSNGRRRLGAAQPKSQSPGLSDSGFAMYLYIPWGFLLLGWFWERSSGGMFNLEIFFPCPPVVSLSPLGRLTSSLLAQSRNSSLTPASPEEKAQGEPRRCWAIGDGGMVVGWQEEAAVQACWMSAVWPCGSAVRPHRARSCSSSRRTSWIRIKGWIRNLGLELFPNGKGGNGIVGVKAERAEPHWAWKAGAGGEGRELE